LNLLAVVPAGTQVLQVTQDYEQWLHVGMVKAAPKLLLGLQQLVFPSQEDSGTAVLPTSHSRTGAIFRRKLVQQNASNAESDSEGGLPATAVANSTAQAPMLSMCLNLNSSLCSSSVKLSKKGGFLLVVYNPLSWSYTWGIRVPVDSGNYSVIGPDGKPAQSQLLPLSVGSQLIWRTSQDAKGDNSKPSSDLALVVEVPPLGHVVYKVVRHTDAEVGQQGKQQQPAATSSVSAVPGNSSMQLSNGKLQLIVGPTGISSVSVAGGSNVSFSSALMKYHGNFHRSGAYTFTAAGEPQLSAPKEVFITQGPVVQEVRLRFDEVPGAMTIRLWAGQSHLEVEWTVGPSPSSGGDWEAFVRYSSDMKSESLWFTDANGREYQQRRRDYRPSFKLPAGATTHPLPANIYPITTGCYLQDAKSVMNVAVDRAQGVVSLSDGQLDINLHRTSVGDDGKGMSEALIDRHVASGVHILSFGPANDSSTTTDSTTRRHYEQVTPRI
jgi:hypothetical protein